MFTLQRVLADLGRPVSWMGAFCAWLALLGPSSGASAAARATRATCDPITVAPATLPRPDYCLDYGASLTASGGRAPYTFAVTAGSLPDGLVLSPSGALSGVPTATGAWSFTVTATDADGSTGSASYVVPVSKGFRAADDQVQLPIPVTGSGGSGNPQLDTTASTVAASGILQDGVAVLSLEVHVTLLHARDGDLVLTLVAPDSTRIVLADRRGGLGQDYLGTVFGAEGAEDICDGLAPFAATYRPEDPLGPRPANGTWTLEVEDVAAGGTGVLLDWSLDVHTASAGMPITLQPRRVLWERTFSAAPNGLALDSNHAYVTAGDSVTRIDKAQPSSPSNWVRTFPSSAVSTPLLTERSFATPSEFLLVFASGFVHGLNPADGTTYWSRDLRRPACTGDLLGAVAVQRWDRSDCAFRSVVADDLVFVGTSDSCGDATRNRVYALNAGDGTTRWVLDDPFLKVDRVTGLIADASRNLVFVTTRNGAPQSSAWALRMTATSTHEIPAWGRNMGDLAVPPVLADGLIVLSRSGQLAKLDPDTGATVWSLTLGGAGRSFPYAMAHDPARGLLLVLNSFSELQAIRDLGTSAAVLWTQGIVDQLSEIAVTPARHWVYGAAVGGRVYKFDELTGNVDIDFFHQFGPASGVTAASLRVDSTTGGGFVEARLMLMRDLRMQRTRAPWTPADTPGVLGSDFEIAPAAALEIQGSTYPPAPYFGQLVVDTLTVENHYNRAPECAVVQTTLPQGMTLVGAVLSQGTFSLVGDQLTGRLGPVQIGQKVDLTVTLRAEAGGTLGRTYSVSSELTDPNAQDNSVTLENRLRKTRLK